MFQMEVRREGPHVYVDGLRFHVGMASGASNNCLLDTLRQQFEMVVHLTNVRRDLQRRFPRGPDQVTRDNFLTLHAHWRDAVDLLFQWDVSGKPRLTHTTFRIVCVDLVHLGHGDVVGDGPHTIYIAREGQVHFVPLIGVQLRSYC